MNLKEQIDEVLSTLTEREQKVIRLRFGLDDGQSRTLEKVGSLLPNKVYGGVGVQKERVRQIEARALRRLRHHSRTKKLCSFLEKKPFEEMKPSDKLLRAILGE